MAGIVATMLLLGGGLFWWQSHADSARPVAVVQPLVADEPEGLPAGDGNAVGQAPPMPAEARPEDREARRFARYDRNRDGIITRAEMLSSRTRDFRKLDKDGNNLLSFEEWAVSTAERFDGADANHDAKLTHAEFATTAPKPGPKPKCKC